ncbi:LOW QUALITY PROTEIN: uncharacterized protein LOC105425129 [Pogonomyrmex barbatus]|uniref:LOW QUALITY PROTEIN: uncharacterized protein LOC105425129 n=1 Tax=Pogonomyrmex barbatus TaxID=144034 RepID=A0A6I9W2E1_9HYME|nr:LOW QUALITY PROTEIN: uncharacterized protein LOC105425129 [Pogonomyrmex barbatus]
MAAVGSIVRTGENGHHTPSESAWKLERKKDTNLKASCASRNIRLESRTELHLNIVIEHVFSLSDMDNSMLPSRERRDDNLLRPTDMRSDIFDNWRSNVVDGSCIQNRKSTTHNIIKETCAVLSQVSLSIYIKVPPEDDWKHISNDFLANWNLPNCIGIIDYGKHITIQAPSNSGSMYFNYKKTFSIVLMTAGDSKYKFTLIDVDAFGSESNGGILSRSAFDKALYDPPK